MMSRGSLVLRCAALVLTLASARAQDRQNGFYLTSPLSLSSGYDQGFIVGSTALNDSVTILTAPTFNWVQSTHRTDFSIDYEPEFDFFARNPKTYWLPRLAIEPSSTAALLLR